MSQVTVYGASDDLIEVEGDLNEEFNPSHEDDGMWLVFGDGTILDIKYDLFGVWRIERLAQGAAYYEIDKDPGDDENRYSDRVTLTGSLKWVLAAEKPVLHKIEDPARA